MEYVQEHSAGGVVLNNNGQVIVVSQQNGASWCLPKGHIEKDEDVLQAAIREVYEETGIEADKLNLVKELGSYVRFRINEKTLKDDKTKGKHLTFFLFTTEETNLKPQDKMNPEALWVKIEDVSNLLTHPKDKEFFLTICSQLDI